MNVTFPLGTENVEKLTMLPVSLYHQTKAFPFFEYERAEGAEGIPRGPAWFSFAPPPLEYSYAYQYHRTDPAAIGVTRNLVYRWKSEDRPKLFDAPARNILYETVRKTKVLLSDLTAQVGGRSSDLDRFTDTDSKLAAKIKSVLLSWLTENKYDGVLEYDSHKPTQIVLLDPVTWLTFDRVEASENYFQVIELIKEWKLLDKNIQEIAKRLTEEKHNVYSPITKMLDLDVARRSVSSTPDKKLDLISEWEAARRQISSLKNKLPFSLAIAVTLSLAS